MANYIAKYATKSLTAPGLPDRRIRTTFDISPALSAHFKRMIVTAWQLGASTRPAIRGCASGPTCWATAATS